MSIDSGSSPVEGKLIQGSRGCDECVMLFVKYPAPGKVKSRLAVSIGSRSAAELYRCFITDIITMLSSLRCTIAVCYYPESARMPFIQWLGSEYAYLPQRGRDIGERMKNAFVDAFDHGVSRALILGSDVPDLPAWYVREALVALKSTGCVIGPVRDGGYCGIGFAGDRFMPEVFSRIAWGSDTVYSETLTRLNRYFTSHYVHVLPQWQDIDTYADLCDYFVRNRQTEQCRSETWRYITTRGLVQSSPDKDSGR